MLLPSTKSAFHRQANRGELVVCIFGSVIERFYDDESNETYIVVMTVGSDFPSVVDEQGRYHSLQATVEIGVIFEAYVHIYIYHPFKTEDILED